MSNYGWVPRPDDVSDDYLERLALLVARRPRMIEISNTLLGFIAAARCGSAAPAHR